MTLFRDGVKLVDLVDPLTLFFDPVQVPPGPATYRYEQDSVRGSPLNDGVMVFDRSVHVTTSWTFRSQHVAGDAEQVLSLPTLRFLPELDHDSRPPHRVMVLPVLVERPPSARTPRIAQLDIEVSFDDGATWAAVPGVLLGDRWFGVVVNPADAACASLRGRVRDVEGNAGDQTIIHAYRVAKR